MQSMNLVIVHKSIRNIVRIIIITLYRIFVKEAMTKPRETVNGVKIRQKGSFRID